MNILYRTLIYVVVITLALWTILTLWTQAKGPARSIDIGNPKSPQKALVVYDPDPFYNLDEQVCLTLGSTLARKGMRVKVATVATLIPPAEGIPDLSAYDLYIFCANTYNWRPDWAIRNFIQRAPLEDKPVVAITLGAGSTGASQRALERLVTQQQGRLLRSRSFWLLRPNDESRLDQPNVDVCLREVAAWTEEMSDLFEEATLATNE